jgi:hypothetical protein
MGAVPFFDVYVTTSRKETRRNVARVVFWVGVALVFGVWVALTRGTSAAAEYYAAYLLEESLSIDNIFVFAIIFSQLHIPPRYSAASSGGASRAHSCSGR